MANEELNHIVLPQVRVNNTYKLTSYTREAEAILEKINDENLYGEESSRDIVKDIKALIRKLEINEYASTGLALQKIKSE